MRRAGDNSLLLVAVCLGLVSSASAAFDYQNVLDETIAMYILVGIAVVYFTFTGFLVILAVYCGCCKKKHGHTKREGGKHPKVDPGTFHMEERKPQAKKPPLSPIKETAFDSQPSPHKSSRHRISQGGLRRQEEEDKIPLNESGPMDQPPSPTDSNTIDLPPQDHEPPTSGSATDLPPQTHEQTHREPSHTRLAPIQRTPNQRRKNKVDQQSRKPPAPGSRNTSDVSLHGPSRETRPLPPSQHTATGPVRRTPNLRKKRKIQPSSDHLTSEGDSQHSRPPSQATEASMSGMAAVSPYDSEHALQPVRCSPDIRKNSPRMQRKGKVLPSPTAPALATSSHISGTASRIPHELGPKDTQIPGAVDTSVAIMSPGFKEVKSVSSHASQNDSKTKIPESSSKVKEDLEPEDTQFPGTEFSSTSKKSHLETSTGIMNPGFKEVEKVDLLTFQNELKPVARHWYKIGQQLQIPESTLKTIRTIHWKNYEKCLGEVCINWLKEESNPTWNKVVRALRSDNLVPFTGRVADDLQKKYCPKPASMSSATSAKSYTML